MSRTHWFDFIGFKRKNQGCYLHTPANPDPCISFLPLHTRTNFGSEAHRIICHMANPPQWSSCPRTRFGVHQTDPKTAPPWTRRCKKDAWKIIGPKNRAQNWGRLAAPPVHIFCSHGPVSGSARRTPKWSQGLTPLFVFPARGFAAFVCITSAGRMSLAGRRPSPRPHRRMSLCW